MSRYDHFKDGPPPGEPKKSQGKPIKPDSISGEIGDHVRTEKTDQLSRNLMIRGPDGFAIFIPLRFVNLNVSQGELRIALPPETAHHLEDALRGTDAWREDPQHMTRNGSSDENLRFFRQWLASCSESFL